MTSYCIAPRGKQKWKKTHLNNKCAVYKLPDTSPDIWSFFVTNWCCPPINKTDSSPEQNPIYKIDSKPEKLLHKDVILAQLIENPLETYNKLAQIIKIARYMVCLLSKDSTYKKEEGFWREPYYVYISSCQIELKVLSLYMQWVIWYSFK